MKKLILPGLVVYLLLSGLGLFLGSGSTSPFFIPYLAGLLVLIAIALSLSLFSSRTVPRPLYIGFGIIAMNLLIQLSGGGNSPVIPAYFLLAALAAFYLTPRYAFASIAAILGIEAGNLLMTGTTNTAAWLKYGGFALTLAGVTGMLIPITRRIRKEAHRAHEKYERLLADAEAMDPLAAGKRLSAMAKEDRQAANVSAAVEREGAFKGLIDIIAGMVPAHTYAVFLADRNDGQFLLRAIRSTSAFLSAVGKTTVIPGTGLIGICAEKNRPQYLSDVVIPARSLGYYTRDIPVRSFLALPIPHGDSNIGILVVDSLERDAFSDALQDALTRFVPFFSQIIEKIRITQELDVKAKNFATLHEMSEVLSSSLDIGDILKNLSKQIRSVIACEFSAFVLYDGTSNEAVITTLEGYDPRFEGSRFPVDEKSAILSHMLKQWRDRSVYKQYHFPDMRDRGREVGLFPVKELRRPLRSLYGRPLVAREKFIGAFFLGSFQPNAFSEHERHLIDTLMNQVALVIDNTKLHEDIRNMARTDGLTGLLNHRTFMEKLHEESVRSGREPRPFSLLLADIDHFKKINDTYGHPVGDIALKHVAGILRETGRGADFVARYGGEEFAVGMVSTDKRGAQQMAERVRKSIEKTVVTAARIEIRLTISVGIASFPEDTRTMGDLLVMADQALYEAKRSGRNRVCTREEIRDLECAPLRAGGAG